MAKSTKKRGRGITRTAALAAPYDISEIIERHGVSMADYYYETFGLMKARLDEWHTSLFEYDCIPPDLSTSTTFAEARSLYYRLRLDLMRDAAKNMAFELPQKKATEHSGRVDGALTVEVVRFSEDA